MLPWNSWNSTVSLNYLGSNIFGRASPKHIVKLFYKFWASIKFGQNEGEPNLKLEEEGVFNSGGG